MSIEELISRFSDYLRYSGKSQRTIYLYTLRVRDFLEYVGKPVEEITRDDVINYYRYLERVKKYNERSLYTVGWALKSFFTMIGRNDIAMWVPTPSFRVLREPEWIPFERILCVIDNDPALCIAYDLALRVGEVVLLRREKYNPETGEIEVYRLKKKGKPMSQILVVGGTEPRTHCKDVLDEYIHRTGGIYEGPLFNITPRTLQYRFKRRLRLCGLDPNKYTFHALRHSRLTHMAIHQLRRMGYVDIVSLAKFAGHASTDTTMMYVHLAHKYLSFTRREYGAGNAGERGQGIG